MISSGPGDIVKDQLGRLYNIEMQMVAAVSLRSRLLYYWAKLYGSQLDEGDDYRRLRPTISVLFVDDVVFRGVSGHHLRFRLIDDEHRVALSDHLEIHCLELSKFDRGIEALSTPLDCWLCFLRHAPDLDPAELPASLGVPGIRRAMEVLTMLTKLDMEKEIYEGRLKARRDQTSFLADALDEGLQRGAPMGRIEQAQRLLGQEVTPRPRLQAMPLGELAELADRLEEELQKRLR